ncbi:MAG: hypothetical protein ACXVB9_20020 [Bdellovibrionota bacterium]
MKSLFLVTVLSLSPLAAMASSAVLCTQASGTGDSGYQAEVSADSQSAVLMEESIAGPQKVAEMKCEHLMIPMNTGAGERPFLRCTEDDAKKGSYVIQLSSTGFAQGSAVVAEVSKAGAHGDKVIAKLSCKAEK